MIPARSFQGQLFLLRPGKFCEYILNVNYNSIAWSRLASPCAEIQDFRL